MIPPRVVTRSNRPWRGRKGGATLALDISHPLAALRGYAILEELHIAVPEKPDLELLHEERNNIQHKYGNPSPDDAAFHIQKAMGFLRRFTKDQLHLDIKDYVPAEYLDQI